MNYKDFSVEDLAEDGFFIRWVKGDDAEAEWFWQSFQKEHPEKIRDVEEAKKLVKALSFRKDELSTEAFDSMRNRLIMAIHAEKEYEKENVKEVLSQSKTRVLTIPWLKVAAAVAVPLIGVAIYLFVINQTGSNTLSQNKFAIQNVEERINSRGQKSELILSDGTKVWLNADSRLKYEKDFDGHNTREVYLEGEAFFDVVRNPSKPFIVHTSALTINVLGTSFNVKSYGEEGTIETTLVHGKVSINKTGGDNKDGSLILKPNQKAIFQKDANTLNVEEIVADHSAAWRYNRLVFDETSFDDAIKQLERWFNITIHVEGGQNLQCKLTADVEKESLKDVLDLLVASHQIQYSISGSEVFIRGTFCK